MTEKEAFLQRLEATFQIEAREHLANLTSTLLELEQAPGDEVQATTVEDLYREAHSLKGAARTVDRSDIEEVSQALESVLAALKRRELDASSHLLDSLVQVVDGLGHVLSSPDTASVPDLVQRLSALLPGEMAESSRALAESRSPAPTAAVSPATEPVPAAPPAPPPVSAPPPDRQAAPVSAIPGDGGPAAGETVRLATAKLDSLLLQSEEMMAASLMAAQRGADVRDLHAGLEEWKKAWARVHADVRSVRSLADGNGRAETTRLVDFLEWNHAYVTSLGDRLADMHTRAEQDRRSVAGMVDQLLEDMKQARMHPFASFAEGFPKLVRDLSREQGKEVDLVIQAGSTEMDRRILEQMKDPFTHLLRNAVDHGIETPRERHRHGKPERATITVAVSSYDSARVEIVLSDDGCGIDIAAVRAAALKSNALSSEEADRLEDQQALSLIFQSDVTTSDIITDVSGRGLGLAIVRERVENLGGTVSVDAQPGMGTSFRMLLPCALATFRGVLVQVHGRPFAIPTRNVEQAVRIRRDDIRTVEGRETIALNGDPLSLVFLDRVLELPPDEHPPDETPYLPAIVLTSGEERTVFCVDAVVNEQAVLVKNLGAQLSRVRNVTGATVLGSGELAPILNVPDLMASAVVASGQAAGAAVTPSQQEDKEVAVLVAEDSITSRMLLKNILESSGYRVATAVDGVDAFTQLRADPFDLLVSDVEMPRLDGFGLTARIRGDEKLSQLPVILVTALDAREDRERGVEAGADAYIVKSSFDQSNLLDTVRRLI